MLHIRYTSLPGSLFALQFLLFHKRKLIPIPSLENHHLLSNHIVTIPHIRIQTFHSQSSYECKIFLC